MPYFYKHNAASHWSNHFCWLIWALWACGETLAILMRKPIKVHLSMEAKVNYHVLCEGNLLSSSINVFHHKGIYGTLESIIGSNILPVKSNNYKYYISCKRC